VVKNSVANRTQFVRARTSDWGVLTTINKQVRARVHGTPSVTH